ncbi:MAG: hypothetical protein QXZ09_09820, partial [Candidatus Methanomethylicaceae archaeon]
MSPLKVYFKVSVREDEIAHLFNLLRRLGTTDSLINGTGRIEEKEPNIEFTCKETTKLKLDVLNLSKRPVSTLNEIKPEATFAQVNPFNEGRRGNPYFSKIYVLPLIEERRGENW